MSDAPPPSNITDDVNSESSLQSFASDIRSALEEFRENWQRELTTENAQQQHQQELHDNIIQQQQQGSEEDSEAQDELCALSSDSEQLQKHAESLFRKAVELEQRGKVYDALPYYRKAIQIVPDIEFKFYEQQKLLNSVSSSSMDATSKTQVLTNINENKSTECQNDNEDHEGSIEDLCEKFSHDICAEIYGGKLLLSNRDAGVVSTELHISDLPPEILIYILRWVVSTQLDMRSLEQCSAVSKGMYLCARDEELWRLACKRVWGHNLGTLQGPNENGKEQHGEPVYYSWREMFQKRERVHFNGCYISKTTYLRMGENSFQDQYYRPVQLVEYYRYIRFLPDGKVYMMTNADEPAQGVNKLKQLHNLRSDVLRGHYRLYGDRVTLWLHKNIQAAQSQNQPQTHGRHQRRGSFLHGTATEDANSTQYVIEFRIISTAKRRFVQLSWLCYSIVQKRNKVETTSDFDMLLSKYPPLWFSPVRSYHLDADAPLT